MPSSVGGVSYYSRQRGGQRNDDSAEDSHAGVPRSANAMPNSPIRGAFAARLPKRAVSYPMATQAPASLSPEPWMTRVTGAIANGAASAAAAGGVRSSPNGLGSASSPVPGGRPGKVAAVGSPHRPPTAMPFVVLDGEVARGQTPMSSPMLSISGRKVAQ